MEKMTAQEAAEWGKTLDFPTVWVALMITQDAKDAAHKAGFYVLEPAGEAVVRIPDPPGFNPKQYTLQAQAGQAAGN